MVETIDALYRNSKKSNIEKIDNVLQKYKETGDSEFLLHIANLAMLEFTHPQHIQFRRYVVRDTDFLKTIYLD